MADSDMLDNKNLTPLSGVSGTDYANKQTNTIESYIKTIPETKMNNDLPRVPSNQGKLLDD